MDSPPVPLPRVKSPPWHMNCVMTRWKAEPLKWSGLPDLPMPFSPVQRQRKFYAFAGESSETHGVRWIVYIVALQRGQVAGGECSARLRADCGRARPQQADPRALPVLQHTQQRGVPPRQPWCQCLPSPKPARAPPLSRWRYEAALARNATSRPVECSALTGGAEAEGRERDRDRERGREAGCV